MPGNTRPHTGNGAEASGPSFRRLTTQSAAQRDRLDYWRQLFTAPLIGSLSASPAADDYQGELLRGGGHDGVAFANIRADPNVCHFGKRESGLMLLGYLRSGQACLRWGRVETMLLPGSGLVLFDCDRPVSMSTTRHDMAYLVLPRSFVAASMGRDPAAQAAAAFRLPESGLTPILWAHLEAMTLYGERLDGVEARTAVQAASMLALALLTSVHHQRFETGAFDEALFVAACQYIEQNAENPSLTAQHVAAGLGCSRAHLYRVFAQRDRTVIGCLRTLRLQRAHGLLEARPEKSVGVVASLCGYTDLSAFGKAFRRQFGMTPRDCQQMVCGKHPLA